LAAGYRASKAFEDGDINETPPYFDVQDRQRDTGKRRIEEEAHDLVFGDRGAAYGHPASDFQAMGRIAAAILSRWLESGSMVVHSKSQPCPDNEPQYLPDIPPQVVALLMTAVKLSRQSANPKRDNLVDLIGYALCADLIIEGE
jgi:hypothetical protein